MSYRAGVDRVLFVEHRSEIGGGQKVLYNLLSRLGGWPEWTAVIPPGSELRAALEAIGGRILCLEMPPWGRKLRPVRMLSVGAKALGAWVALYRVIGRERIGLVQANDLFSLLTVLPPARWRRVRVICHVHSFAGLDHPAVGMLLRRTDRVVPVCRSLSCELRRRWRLPAGRLRPVRNGIEPDRVLSAALEGGGAEAPRAGGPVVGTVTTFHPAKGFRFLLTALARLRDAGPEIGLTVLGDGPGRGASEAAAAELGLGGRVRFLGYQSNPYPSLRRLDLYVSPSLSEAAPVSILEAMALGVPVLATAVGGVPEMIEHGVSGWLVPPSDPEALAGALELLLSDRELRRRLATAAGERVRAEFGAEGMAAEFRGIYRSLLGGGSPGKARSAFE